MDIPPPSVVHVPTTTTTTTTSSSSTSNNKRHAFLNPTAENNSQAVNWLRWALVFVLVAATVTVAVVVYLYTSSRQVTDFELQFESDADKLLASVQINFQMTMSAGDDFMHRIMYHYRSLQRTTNATWPFIPALPGLAVQASKLMSQTNSIYMAFYPLIRDRAERVKWENFTRHNDGWVEEALRVQAKDPNFHGPILEQFDKSYSIWRNEGPEPDDLPGPFLPSWMGSPVIPYYYPFNWNALAYDAFAKGLLYSMKTKSVVVTPVANNADPNDPVAVAQAQTTSDWSIPYLEPGENPNEPFSDMYYPVLENIDDVVMDTRQDNPALGNVAFSFYWRHILKNILPANSEGLVMVFANPCGPQGFTYQIDGPKAIFLGFGDLHESKFDSYGSSKSSSLANLTNSGGTYTGLPMNAGFCPYTITIYPSSAMQCKFITTEPVIFACGSALIFIFVAALFCVYDFLMRREFSTKQRLLEMKKQLMRFVTQEVQRPLNAVCHGLSLLQDDMNYAVPSMTENRLLHMNSNFLLDDCNVNLRTMALEDDADHLRTHLEGWIAMTRELCHSAESSAVYLTDLLNLDKLQQTGSFSMDLAIISVWNLVQRTSREFWLSARKMRVRYTLDNRFQIQNTSSEDSDEQKSTTKHAEEDPARRLDTMKIVGDERLLTQLLRNLVSNSLKFTPEGGNLTICTYWEPIQKSEKVGLDKYKLASGKDVALKRHCMARIDVTDTGEGMSDEEMEKLFPDETIFQNGLEQGKGLGLFISKKMALQHGGDLTATSDGLGLGSTFSLRLPLYLIPEDSNQDTVEDSQVLLAPLPAPEYTL